MSKKHSSIVDELRRTIRQAEKAGTTRYRLAALAGVDQSQLSKLMLGKLTPTLPTGEKILRALGKRLAITDIDAGK
jgi:predicted transcriptional regulator